MTLRQLSLSAAGKAKSVLTMASVMARLVKYIEERVQVDGETILRARNFVMMLVSHNCPRTILLTNGDFS